MNGHRWARAMAAALLAMLLLLAVLLVFASILLQQLDAPWLKSRLTAAIENSTGLSLDYRHAEISLRHGLRLDDLVVLAPAPFRAATPELLRLHHLQADWTAGALIRGPVRVERVALQGLAVHVAMNENGEHSLSDLLARFPSEPEEPKTIAQQLAEFFAQPLPLRNVELSGISAEFVQVRHGVVADRWALSGLGLSARMQDQSPSIGSEDGWLLQADMEKPGQPAALVLRREAAGQPPASAQLALALSALANARGGSITFRLDLGQQDFDSRLQSGPMLQGAVTARTDAGPGVLVELQPTTLAGSVVAEARLTLPEAAGHPIEAALIRVDADLAHLLALVPADLRPFTLKEGRLHLEVNNLALAPDAPQEASARARLTLSADTLRATLAAEKEQQALHWKAALQAPDLDLLRPLLPAATAARIRWQGLQAELESEGRITALLAGQPRLKQETTLHLQGAGWDDMAIRDLGLHLQTEGDARQQAGELHLQSEGLRLGGQDLGPQQHTLAFELDRQQPALHLRLGRKAGLDIALDTTLHWDAKARALDTALNVRLPAQTLPAPLLARAGVPAAFDSSRLALELDAKGRLTGLITAFTPEGRPELAADPLASAAFQGQAHIHAENLRWREDALSVSVPALDWQLASTADAARTLTSEFSLPRVRIRQAERSLTVTDVSAQTSTHFNTSVQGPADLALQLKVGKLEQQPALPWPVANLEWRLRAERESDSVIRLPEMHLTHAGTRTALDMKGRLELAADRRRLQLEGALQQDLAGIQQAGVLEGQGQAHVEFQLTSPDLNAFHTQAALHLDKVDLKLPASGIQLRGVNGDVPLFESFRLAEGKLRLMQDVEPNPYAMLRFADQHPLLARSGYISAETIATPWATMAPLAGNLSIQQNVFALTQLEMGLRGGRITGQSRLDWRGPDSTLEARVRATGVLSSHGEPFDGNIAVVITARNRSVQGRAEILRIGNRHLLDLLDLADPYAADPGLNRLRLALRLGYPKQVRLRFDNGFGSLLVQLGGMARLIHIDEIRGIPVGPIVNRALQQLPELGP